MNLDDKIKSKIEQKKKADVLKAELYSKNRETLEKSISQVETKLSGLEKYGVRVESSLEVNEPHITIKQENKILLRVTPVIITPIIGGSVTVFKIEKYLQRIENDGNATQNKEEIVSGPDSVEDFVLSYLVNGRYLK